MVGSNTPETIEQVFPGNLDYTDASGAKKTITIDPGVTGINQAIVDAKAAGADVVIALIHQGWLGELQMVFQRVSLNTMAAQDQGCCSNLWWSQPPDFRISNPRQPTRCTSCHRTNS